MFVVSFILWSSCQWLKTSPAFTLISRLVTFCFCLHQFLLFILASIVMSPRARSRSDIDITLVSATCSTTITFLFHINVFLFHFSSYISQLLPWLIVSLALLLFPPVAWSLFFSLLHQHPILCCCLSYDVHWGLWAHLCCQSHRHKLCCPLCPTNILHSVLLDGSSLGLPDSPKFLWYCVKTLPGALCS